MAPSIEVDSELIKTGIDSAFPKLIGILLYSLQTELKQEQEHIIPRPQPGSPHSRIEKKKRQLFQLSHRPEMLEITAVVNLQSLVFVGPALLSSVLIAIELAGQSQSQ